MRRTLYHLHVSWWRRTRRETVGPAGPEPVSDDPTDAMLTSVAVRRALAKLAPRQRAVIVLRYYEDLTETQAAEVLGISVGTVKSHARDALDRLRRLAPELDGRPRRDPAASEVRP